MHATIQKKMDVILGYLSPGEKVFVVGCGNCAEKCKSGGPAETEEMAGRLKKKGVEVVGYASTPSAVSLCKLSVCRKMLTEEHKKEAEAADSFLVLACGQGVHTVIDATDGGMVHVGCDTIFGGETEKEEFIREYCSLCGECLIEYTGGLCPLTLCSKGLLNGPCGGAKDGKCEVDREKDCGWELIYQRLKKIGRLDLLDKYQEPKNYARWSRPRSLEMKGKEATFISLAGKHTVSRED
jgi:ferredoxin